jgi:carbonic anhydrase/acetyltransferase-like protein (isoleucine patch superfamily)
MILPFFEKLPQLKGEVFIEKSARVIGDVQLGDGASIWFNVVVRGDVNYIRIGDRTNIQDGSVVHVTRDTHPTILGDDVTVGHNVTLHGCTIGNRVLVGMGAVVLDGVDIGDDCIIGAGSVVAPGTKVPAGHLALGNPARVKRPLKPQEISHLRVSADNYIHYMRQYLSMTEEGCGKIG